MKQRQLNLFANKREHRIRCDAFQREAERMMERQSCINFGDNARKSQEPALNSKNYTKEETQRRREEILNNARGRKLTEQEIRELQELRKERRKEPPCGVWQ